MENCKFLQLSLQGSFIFLFLRDIKQNALPVKRISIFITNEICIFLDPNDFAIAPDNPIFLKKTGTIVTAIPLSFSTIRSRSSGWMDLIHISGSAYHSSGV